MRVVVGPERGVGCDDDAGSSSPQQQQTSVVRIASRPACRMTRGIVPPIHCQIAPPPENGRPMIRCSVFALLALGLLGCTSKPATSAAPARFTVTDQVIARDFVGFGGEMNPYLYCRPNWDKPSTTQPAQGAVNDQNVAALERRVIELAPQHVRIFVLLHWWTPGGDYEIAKGDPRMVESFLRTVRLAQRAGATVNLTLWYGPFPQPEESGRQFARLLDDLVNRQGLSCVRYVTIQNEPNSTKMTAATYCALYLALDDELRRL